MAKRSADEGGAGGGKKSRLQQKTAAQFFAENKHFAGFESPGKSLYTSIRELVENRSVHEKYWNRFKHLISKLLCSLDAAESIGVLPDIRIDLREVPSNEYRKMHGMDIATVDDPPDKGEGDDKGKAASKGKSGPKKISAKSQSYYDLCVTDNGSGMKHDEIPKMFGTVLSGTKYGVRQERGKFGLGSKMVLLWSKMSTGMPMLIRSSQGTSKPVSEVELDLDVFSNSPNIHRHEKVENKDRWRGSQIKVTIGGEFSKYRRYVINYLREMAVITPYARFEMHYRAEDHSKSFDIVHSRRSEVMPPPPSKAKVHPASLDNSVLDNLLRTTPQKTLLRFLTAELDAVDKKTAMQLIDDLGPPFSPEMDVHTIDTSKVRKMVDKIHGMEFDPPSGKVLSPAGEYNLHLGVMKEMRPDMIATSTQDVTVVDGHAVLVEAAVALGGRRAKEGIHVHRFANRIPMLFQQGNDVSARTANSRINWKSYRIDKNSQKIGVYVSICSTKIPYGGPNKEYIGDENEDLQKVVRDAIMKCCVQLKSRLARAEWIKNQKDRKKNLEKYIPHVARALSSLIQTIADESPVAGDQAPENLKKVVDLHRQKLVTEGILQQKLRTFVEEADMEQALSSAQVWFLCCACLRTSY